MRVFYIEFQPVGRRDQCHNEESLLECSRRLGIGVNNICGGNGTCGTCRLRILSGQTSDPTATEKEHLTAYELKEGWRLACQTYPNSDCLIHVPAESMTTSQRIHLESREVSVVLEPKVKSYELELAPPTLTDLVADADRLLAVLNHKYNLQCSQISYHVLKSISANLRDWDWQCRAAACGDEVIAILPSTSRDLGLAVDIGTTKIAGYLVDLNTGVVLASAGIMNPQISYGDDVITRITLAMKSDESANELQRILVQALNKLADSLCAKAGVQKSNILETVMVGNTAMHHLFLNLPVRYLAVSPFVPCVSSAMDVRAYDLGLDIAPGGFVHILPNIAGFVGADHVSGLLTALPGLKETPAIFIDIGTNTEVSLIDRDTITAVSCASGPAFEGGHIRNGMRAASGAIERVRINNQAKVEYQTIDNEPPVGICGSGILDAVAQLYLAGFINEEGKLIVDKPGVQQGPKGLEFLLVDDQARHVPDVVIAQQDIREIQLAKSAIRTGIQALLESSNLTDNDIKQIIVAGGFGSYIDINSAIEIGMFPALNISRYRQVGNAAGMGARLALVSVKERERAKVIASRVKYLELASTTDFMPTFILANYFGRYSLSHGEKVPI